MYVFVSESGEGKKEIKWERKKEWTIDWLNEGTNELMDKRTNGV